MYEEYKSINPPQPESMLWRYMGIDKLERLLADNGLYFCRQDLFEDPKEGITPQGSQDRAHQDLYAQGAPAGLSSVLNSMKDSIRKRMYICCWRQDEVENSGMWNLYGGDEDTDCIAIKLSFSALVDSIIDERKFHVGTVEYVDMEHHATDGDIFKQACLKRLEFKNEQEVRLLHHVPGPSMGAMSEYMEGESEAGLVLSIDSSKFVRELLIHPKADPQYVERCKDLINTYGLQSCSINQSSLFAK